MARPSLVYVGTYSAPGGGEGSIHTLRLDAATGTLTEVGAIGCVRNPSYLVFDRSQRFLYAVNELLEYDGRFGGAVSAFAVDAETGGLTALNTQPTHGADPCHLSVDRSGRHLLVANYTSGHVTVLPIRGDGSLGPASQVVAHVGSSVHPVRQTGAHVHHVAVDAAGSRVFVTDLGLDQVLAYIFDTASGNLVADDPPFVALAPGAGPRQTVLRDRHAYVLNELGSSVTVHSYDEVAGRLTPGRTVSTLPDGFGGENSCAEVQVAPSGRFLYASNRGHDSVAVFAISPDSGELTLSGHVGTGGATPRNFGLDPSGELLVAANQNSGTVVLFRIDQSTGMPVPTGSVVHVERPVCVLFSGR